MYIVHIIITTTTTIPTIVTTPLAERVRQDGMKVQGYNGSMAWDTSFAVQAAVEADLVAEFKDEIGDVCYKIADLG